MGVAVAVVVPTALPHGLKEIVSIALRGEQERAAGNIDDAMIFVQRVLKRMRHVPAKKHVRQMQIRQENEGDSGETPKPNKRLLMLSEVRKDRATTDGCDKPQCNGMRCLMDLFRKPRRGKAREWKEGEENREDGAVNSAQDGRKVAHFVKALQPALLLRVWCRCSQLLIVV